MTMTLAAGHLTDLGYVAGCELAALTLRELERGQADKYAHGWALPANPGNAHEYQALLNCG